MHSYIYKPYSWQRLLFCGWLLFAIYPTFAESTAYFQHISAEHGLAQNTVYAILRDETGYMWFATDSGLSRYDGYEFVTYRHDPKRTDSLSENRVKTLYEDSKQNLWIGTRNGLNRFNREHNSFIRYQHDPANSNSLSNNNIQAIIEDEQGYLWIGTKDGLNRFDPGTKNFSLHRLKPDIYSDIKQSFIQLARDDSNFLWAATDGLGLIRFISDWDENNVRHYYHDSFSSNTLASNHVLSLLIDRQARVWLGQDSGFGRLDDEREYFLSYQDIFASLKVEPTLFTALHQDDAGIIWLGTRQQGLYAVNPVNRQITPFLHDAANSSGLNDNEILSIYQDRSGPLWIGTGRGGVNLYFRQANRFQNLRHDPEAPNAGLSHPAVLSVWETQDGKVWIGTRHGLNRYDPKTGSIHQYFANVPVTQDGLRDNRITALYQKQADILWIGTGDGTLHRFNTSEESWVRYGFANEQDEIDGGIIDILMTSDDALLALTKQQLFQLVEASALLEKKPLKFDNPAHEIVEPMSSLYEDRQGNLWIGSRGQGIVSVKDGQATRYLHDPDNPNSLSHNEVHDIKQDTNSRLWIATFGGGLNQFDYKNESFSRYTPNSEIVENLLHSILPGTHGQLWLGGNQAINRFILTGQKPVKRFDVTNGLQAGPKDVAHKGKSGIFYFGGSEGLDFFNPDDFKDNDYMPLPVITRLYTSEDTIEVGLQQLKEVELPVGETGFQAEFSAMSFWQPEKNRYQCKLEGIDTQPRVLNTGRMVTYNNLSPGRYLLRMRAANNDGKWSESEANLLITVTPLFWVTPMAYLLYATVIFIVMGYVIYNERRRFEFQRRELHWREDYNEQLRQEVADRTKALRSSESDLLQERNNAEQAREEAESASRAKSIFLANMSHELRTPLNDIMGYAQLLQDSENFTPVQKDGVNIMLRSSRHLLDLINEVLDLSKIEANRVELSFNRFEPALMLDDLADIFRQRAQQKSIDFVYNSTGVENLSVYGDQRRVRQVLTNLLSNAVKFTETGSVTFTVHYESENLNVRIEDTGPGIPLKEQTSIFLPFQQANPNEFSDGAGLGLAISKRLVDMMSGHLSLDSAPGRGSIFSVRMPLALAESQPATSVQKTQKRITGYNGPAKKILIVDDLEENKKLLDKVLRYAGFQVQAVDNGKDAIRQAEQWQPDAILMDLLMPDMDGFEAVRQIRNLPNLRWIPIFAVSAAVQEQNFNDSFAAGCDEFIAKPVNTAELFEKLGTILGLTWVYADKASSNASDVDDTIAPQHIQDLLDSLEQGDIQAVKDYVHALAQTDQRLGNFADRISAMAEHLEIKKMRETLLKLQK